MRYLLRCITEQANISPLDWCCTLTVLCFLLAFQIFPEYLHLLDESYRWSENKPAGHLFAEHVTFVGSCVNGGSTLSPVETLTPPPPSPIPTRGAGTGHSPPKRLQQLKALAMLKDKQVKFHFYHRLLVYYVICTNAMRLTRGYYCYMSVCCFRKGVLIEDFRLFSIVRLNVSFNHLRVSIT